MESNRAYTDPFRCGCKAAACAVALCPGRLEDELRLCSMLRQALPGAAREQCCL